MFIFSFCWLADKKKKPGQRWEARWQVGMIPWKVKLLRGAARARRSCADTAVTGSSAAQLTAARIPQPQKASDCPFLPSELDGPYCPTPVFGPLLTLM